MQSILNFAFFFSREKGYYARYFNLKCKSMNLTQALRILEGKKVCTKKFRGGPFAFLLDYISSGCHHEQRPKIKLDKNEKQFIISQLNLCLSPVCPASTSSSSSLHRRPLSPLELKLTPPPTPPTPHPLSTSALHKVLVFVLFWLFTFIFFNRQELSWPKNLPKFQ